VNISSDLEEEIRRKRDAGSYATTDELLRDALAALEREQALELLLLEGLDSGDAPFTRQDIENIRAEGIERIRHEKGR
jgi:putative addiction module CopG family antidote